MLSIIMSVVQNNYFPAILKRMLQIYKIAKFPLFKNFIELIASYMYFRIFWLAVFLCCLVTFLITIIGQFQSFFSYHTTTRIRLIEESVVDFPAVTICNLNYVKRSKVEKLFKFQQDVIKTLLPTPFIDSPLDMTSSNVLEQAKGVSIEELYAKTKVQLEDMIHFCQFNLHALPNCLDYFTRVDTHVLECHTFNSHELKNKYNLTTTRPGPTNGLQFNVAIDHKEYYTGTYSAGVKVKFIMMNPP